ncbi:sensor histidine kinase [Agrobacterium rosae]|uniref:sensor histidine kinase n=1 Tax=Agrobacterium rosae TaxID=1972867 RepID=UPI00122F5084|nr:histidine kinase dimerization/phosphoacceptor domain -containing protein [Agrobacterium rosae]KAA3507630.1 PAS domain-containing protein [Agrobacterium rosae]MQB51211.1 PAS domain-containing protein [Agrobacterium rosae]
MTTTQPTADFAAIVRGMPQPYLILNSDLTIVGASDSYLHLTDRTRDDIVGRHILEAFPENPDAVGTVEQGPLEVSLRHVLATGKPHEMAVIQYDIPRPEGGFAQKFWTPVHTPVAGEDGAIEYIIQNPMDVTESVIRSREADARLRIAHHAADLASWEYEPETDIWRRSHSVDELFGFKPGTGGPVAAPYFSRMHPDDLPSVRGIVESAIGSPDLTVLNFDYRIVLPSGEIRYVTSRGEILRTSSGAVRMIGVLMDITADRAREAELSNSVKVQEELLQQKDILLAEVNHRVKNSLQLVVSTLRLQARKLENPDVIEAFEQAIGRVRAIISVHEGLYRTDNSLSVDMADHLTRLCLDLTSSATSRQIEVDVDPIALTTELAIPVSVIVNELIAERLRRTEDIPSPVHLSLKQLSSGFIALMVHDQHASPADAPASELSSRLIASMAAQIDGEFQDEFNGGGFRASVTFPGKGN